jgi:hypothetical protein
MPGALLKKKWHVFSISLCTLFTFLLLYIFRDVDDNRLTSWKWVFADVEIIWFVFLIAAGIIFTYALLNSPVTRQTPSVFLFLSSFAISAIFWKTPEVIVDTSRYFTQAKHLEIYGIRHFVSEWGKDISVWTDLPIVPFLYGLIFKLFGEARAFIQVFTTLVFSMTVVLTYLIGRTLRDEDTGFFAGVLLWGIPYIPSQVPLMLVDIPTMFFLTLSIYTFIRALQKGGVWIAVSSISIFCAVFSKYSTWMMLSVLCVVFMVYLMEGRRPIGKGREQITRIISRGLSVVLAAGLLAGLIVMFKFDVISGQIEFLLDYQAPGLRRWGESFISTFFYQVHPFITIAALYSVYETFRKKDRKFLIVSWLIFLIVLLQIRRSRYVMIVFPMLTLMASYGLQKIKTMEIRRYIVSSVVAASLVVAIFAYLPFLQSTSLVNFKDAGSFLDSIDADRIEVFTVPSKETVVNPAVSVPLLDLFTKKNILYHYDRSFSLPFEKIEKSPLRFTWEYKIPGYYFDDYKTGVNNSVLVVIYNASVKKFPNDIEEKTKGYENIKVFENSSGIFRYSPALTILAPEGM